MVFTNVTWNDNEKVTAEKLNDMAENDTWLKDRLPQFTIISRDGQYGTSPYIEAVSYDIYSSTPESFDSGRILTVQIPFQSAFLYAPIVVAQYVTRDVNYREVSVAVTGLNGQRQPSEDGIKVHVTHNKGSAPFVPQSNTYFIHYIAMGVKA